MRSLDSLARRANLVRMKLEPPVKQVRRLPMVIYDPETGEPLPAYRDIANPVLRLPDNGRDNYAGRPIAKWYGFDPGDDGTEP